MKRPAAAPQRRVPRIVPVVAIVLVLADAVLLYSTRINHPMIYYSGDSPETPGGKASSVLNPFRNRNDEKMAMTLIRDLRTDRCPQIVRERLHTNPAQICPVMRASSESSLVWMDSDRDGTNTQHGRRLIYDLPETKSRLVIYFRNSDAGWGVDTAFLRQ
jgi:hypothetical protein